MVHITRRHWRLQSQRCDSALSRQQSDEVAGARSEDPFVLRVRLIHRSQLDLVQLALEAGAPLLRPPWTSQRSTRSLSSSCPLLASRVSCHCSSSAGGLHGNQYHVLPLQSERQQSSDWRGPHLELDGLNARQLLVGVMPEGNVVLHPTQRPNTHDHSQRTSTQLTDQAHRVPPAWHVTERNRR